MLNRNVGLDLDFSIINWNIGGAKYLELPSKSGWKPASRFSSPDRKLSCREEYKYRLEDALRFLIESIGNRPLVLTLQEVVQYEATGNYCEPLNILEPLFFKELGYEFHFFPLITTFKHSAQAKWRKVCKSGNWDERAYFAQGNAILVREDISLFPVWSIPKVGTSLQKYIEIKSKLKATSKSTVELGVSEDSCSLIGQKQKVKSTIAYSSEVVFVEQGLYFGDRNSEPRAAIVTHIVLDGQITNSGVLFNKPLDIFVVNLHLTTLTNEREGIPSKDEEAGIRRLKQLDIVFNDIISRYNIWKQVKNYKLREDPYPVDSRIETIDRHKPVWIVAGDFNFTPESTEYEYIIKRNFIDLLPNHNIGTKASGLGKDPTLTVDYIFAGPLYYSIQPDNARPRIRANSVQVGEFAKVSDHMPVVANVPIHIENA